MGDVSDCKMMWKYWLGIAQNYKLIAEDYA